MFRSLWMLPIAVFAVAILLSPSAFAKGAAHNSEVSNAAGDAFYIKMSPMVLPVIGDSGIQEVMSLSVALQVKDQRTLESVNILVPKLNDAYMRALYGKMNGSAYRNGRFLDVTKLKIKLVTITDDVLGKGKVDDVLIQGINQRHFD
ncbi:MAG: hypothetical protein HY053_08210 [Proteobacteria bacterium]|nr:hypothetical protein [Pseudomonadota bacterium]